MECVDTLLSSCEGANMKCLECGKENSDYVSFCTACGSILRSEDRESESSTLANPGDTPIIHGEAETSAQEPDVPKYFDLLTKKVSGIRIGADKVQLVEKRHITLSLDREGIESIELRKGFTAKRPGVQVLFGLGLLAVCFFPLRGIFVWWFLGGSISLRATLLMLVLLVPLGTWLIVDGLRKGYFLQVIRAGKRHKLPFGRTTRHLLSLAKKLDVKRIL